MANIIFLSGVIIAIISAVDALPINQSEPGDISGDNSGECVQSLVCAIDRLRDALKTLPYVELQPCLSTRYSCVPNNSDDPITQIHILHSYTQYIVTEGISDNYAYPDQLSNVLEIINTTLPTLQNIVNVSNSQPNNIMLLRPSIPVCGCDTAFQSLCTVHILNTNAQHLIALFSEILPTCCFCTSLEDDAQRYVNDVYSFFSGDYLDEILPPQCRMAFHFAQEEPQIECMNDTYSLQERLQNLTLWMNDTLPVFNNSLPELEMLVETLSASILPATTSSLNGLRLVDSCMGRLRCTGPGIEQEQVQTIARRFENCLAPEPALAEVVQLFDLLRRNFNHFFEHLIFENIASV